MNGRKTKSEDENLQKLLDERESLTRVNKPIKEITERISAHKSRMQSRRQHARRVAAWAFIF